RTILEGGHRIGAVSVQGRRRFTTLATPHYDVRSTLPTAAEAMLERANLRTEAPRFAGEAVGETGCLSFPCRSSPLRDTLASVSDWPAAGLCPCSPLGGYSVNVEWLTAEWVTAIGTLVTATATVGTAVGVLFLWQQTSILRQQARDDHDRSRRESAISLLNDWTAGLRRENSAARRFAETL